MRLRPQVEFDPFEREKLRSKVGDTVLYQGVKYRVTQVGLKYLMAELESNPNVLGMLKVSEVSKYFPPEAEDEHPHEGLKNLMTKVD